MTGDPDLTGANRTQNAGKRSPHRQRENYHRSKIMSSNRNLTTTEPRGLESVGSPFDDISLIQGLEDVVLTRVVVWYGMYINSFTVSISKVLATNQG